MTFDLATWVGFAGMAFIVGAYAYQTASTHPNPYVQHGTNLAGAILLTLSLLVHTNLASLLLEGFWAAIAVYGLGKALLSPSRLREGLGVGESSIAAPPSTSPTRVRAE